MQVFPSNIATLATNTTRNWLARKWLRQSFRSCAGLLRLMSSEDELAAVLAHETAHVLARHHAERMSQLQLTGTLNLITSLVLGFRLPTSVVLLGVFFPYSRYGQGW